MEKFKRAETVEVNINSTATPIFAFADNDNLRGKKIKAIEAYTSSQITKTKLGKNVISANGSKGLMLTFESGGKDAIDEIPYNVFVPSNNNGQKFFVDDLIINLPKSELRITDATNLTSGESVLITFYFE
jgi:hypothetical protein